MEPTCLLLSAAPDEAPTILSVTPHTTTSVLIRWQVSQGGFISEDSDTLLTGTRSQQASPGQPGPRFSQVLSRATDRHEKCKCATVVVHSVHTCTYSTSRHSCQAEAVTPTASEHRDSGGDVHSPKSAHEWQDQPCNSRSLNPWAERYLGLGGPQVSMKPRPSDQ
jgi:hypothetical protein